MIDLAALPKTLEEYGRRIWADGDQLGPMTSCLQERRHRRKLRLFAFACFDIVRRHVTDPRSLAAVEFFERHVEKSGVGGRAGRPALAAAAEAAAGEVRDRFDIRGGTVMTRKQWDDTIAHFAAAQLVSHKETQAAQLCGQFAAQVRLGEWAWDNGHWPPDWSVPAVTAAWAAHQKDIIALLKEVMGDPFQPVGFDSRWRTSTVVALARGIYREKTFEVMPILADALQEAGCDSEDILDHCRGDGSHVRGCWVVDLILGKE